MIVLGAMEDVLGIRLAAHLASDRHGFLVRDSYVRRRGYRRCMGACSLHLSGERSRSREAQTCDHGSRISQICP
jgi:hypothetical protein